MTDKDRFGAASGPGGPLARRVVPALVGEWVPAEPDTVEEVTGRGFSRGFGYGRGYRMNWTRKDELEALNDEEKMLKEELAEIAKAKNDLASAK